MQPQGRLRAEHISDDVRFIAQDAYVPVVIYRGRRGSEVRVHELLTVIAMTSAAAGGLDTQSVIGDSSDTTYVIPVTKPCPEIKVGDEAWAGDDRYRVVAVNHLPRTLQLITTRVQ